MRVLVVENDDRVARAVTRVLRNDGQTVDRATSLAGARERLSGSEYAMALVDLGLDDGDGIDLIRELRDRSDLGVIAVTARGVEADRVRGLKAGADDYLVKPFGAAELLARMEAVMRRVRAARPAPADRGVLAHGRLTIDLDRYALSGPTGEIATTRKEFELLVMLLRQVGAVVVREQILDQIWQSTHESGSRSLDTHMASLRSKLTDEVTITTVRGVGYRLEAADPAAAES